MTVKQLFDLSGRVAIITGGAVGLGRQMADALAEMGANLVLCARKKERCQQAAEEFKRQGVKTLALACDVKNPGSIQEVVDAAQSQFGRIDILINNAGVSWGAPVEEMTLEQWNKVIETNLTGTFLCSQAVGKVMIGQRRGNIINIASVAGLGGSPAKLQAIGYSASKGGVITFTKDLAEGVIKREGDLLLEGIPMRRYGSESDLKGAAVFLASDASAYVTGHVLVVDGGQSVC
jgi:NAD(P)-dependent dehydrogenase (short-subunit alcohol dehydrogenase family)